MQIRLRPFSAVLTALVTTLCLPAQSDRFTAPAFRGQVGALYAGWDDFASATFANVPDRPGSASTGFSFTQLDPAAFVTSSGNLYSFSTPLSHRIDVAALPSGPATVVLQTCTLGAALSAPTVQLETFDGTVWRVAAVPLDELIFSETLGTAFGAAVNETRRWTWTLGAGATAALRLTFQATGTSQSFLAAALDLAPPAPADDLYAAWLAARFSSAERVDPLVSGPAADPDADGLPNLLEYALGGDPRDPSSHPAPQAQVAASRLTLTFSRLADPALVYTVEASPDLADWATVFTSTGAANLPGPAVATDNDAALGPEHPRRFLRLLVARP